MRGLKLPIIFTLGMLAGNCVEPFKLPVIETGAILVVDGLFTTETGPHKVELTWAASPNDPELRSPVIGASLFVEDDLGERTNLVEAQPGIYQTASSWHTMLGRSYRLQIQLQNGSVYESTEQKVFPAGQIDSLFATFTPNAIADIANPDQLLNAFSVFLNSSGSTGQPNLFRWRWKGSYEIFTRPELNQSLIPGCCLVPDPLPCSGYDQGLNQVSACTCCTCWVTEFSRQARVSPNQFANENLFGGINLTKISADGLRFYNKYHLEIEQLSLDKSSYEFWKLVQAQQAGAFDVFQPNVIRIQGNLKNEATPNDVVLGVVSFASVTRKSIFINRSEIIGASPSLPILIMDCSEYNDNTTNVKPPFW